MAAHKPLRQPDGHLDFQSLFQDLPQPFIVMDVDDPAFTILAENQQHAVLTHSQPQDNIGKAILEAFPDTSDKYQQTGVSDLVESFRRVIKSKQPDDLEAFRYDVKDAHGQFEESYWQVTHYPLFDGRGAVVAVCQVTKNVTAELRSNKRLKLAEDRLDRALSIGRVGSWAWDIIGNKVVADRHLADLFGVSTERAAKGLPLKTFVNAIHKDDRARVQASIEQAVAKGSLFEAEYRTNSATGDVRWVIARGQVETNSKGQAVSFPGVIVDITERKLAEARYIEQQELTTAITHSLGEGVFALDAQGKATFINPAAERMLGWKASELLGKHMHSTVHFQDAAGRPFPASKCAMLQVIKKGVAASRDNEVFTRKDGSTFPVSYTAVPLKQGGRVVGAVQSFTDISERRRTERNLRFLADASTQLASSLDYRSNLQAIARLSVPEIADWCSIDLLDNNSQLYRVAIEHGDAAVVKQAKAERAANPVHLDDPSGIAKVIRTGKAEYLEKVSEARLTDSSKNARRLKFVRSLGLQSIIVVPLELERKPVGALSFLSTQPGRYFTKNDFEMAQELAARVSMAMTNAQLYDKVRKELAERERLEGELRQVNEELEQRVSSRTAELQAANIGLERSNRELQDFAYVASHDLQEPLRKIQAFSNLLTKEYAGQLASNGGDGADYLDRMQNAASRMSTLIEDLLSFSRVTTKARPFEKVDLNQILKEVLGDLETRMEDCHGQVKHAKLATITADPLQMRQLLQNLIGNALKFSRPGTDPIITVSLERQGSNWELRVKDNGIGFEQKYADRIFAVFQRLHGREQYQGTGIGLAICRKIAERHGGTIEAKSQPGRGAEFIVRLPVKPLSPT